MGECVRWICGSLKLNKRKKNAYLNICAQNKPTAVLLSVIFFIILMLAKGRKPVILVHSYFGAIQDVLKIATVLEKKKPLEKVG